jgi:hypothetical protein
MMECSLFLSIEYYAIRMDTSIDRDGEPSIIYKLTSWHGLMQNTRWIFGEKKIHNMNANADSSQCGFLSNRFQCSEPPLGFKVEFVWKLEGK